MGCPPHIGHYSGIQRHVIAPPIHVPIRIASMGWPRRNSPWRTVLDDCPCGRLYHVPLFPYSDARAGLSLP